MLNTVFARKEHKVFSKYFSFQIGVYAFLFGGCTVWSLENISVISGCFLSLIVYTSC